MSGTDNDRAAVAQMYLQEQYRSTNLYTYVDNKPLNSVDPFGLNPLAGVAVGALTGGIDGAIGAADPTAGGAIGALMGANFGLIPIPQFTPVGLGLGALTGALAGIASEAAGNPKACLAQLGAAAIAGAMGGALGGYLGGTRGALVGSAYGLLVKKQLGITYDC